MAEQCLSHLSHLTTIEDLMKNHTAEDHLQLLRRFKGIVCDGCWREALRVAANRYGIDLPEDEDSLQVHSGIPVRGQRAISRNGEFKRCCWKQNNQKPLQQKMKEPIESSRIHPNFYPEDYGKVFTPIMKQWDFSCHTYLIEFSNGIRTFGGVLIETCPERVPVPSAIFASLCTEENEYPTYKGCKVFESVFGKYITTGINRHINCGANWGVTDMKVAKGSVAMVYHQHQAVRKLTCQFKIFIDDEQNTNVLVFGRVVSGLDVVEMIAALDDGYGKPGKPIFITHCRLLRYDIGM